MKKMEGMLKLSKPILLNFDSSDLLISLLLFRFSFFYHKRNIDQYRLINLIRFQSELKWSKKKLLCCIYKENLCLYKDDYQFIFLINIYNNKTASTLKILL